MHERRFHGDVGALRSPERLARLEIDRVIEITTCGGMIRSVLDVGTGSGVFAEAFARFGLKVEGVDANPVMLAEARALAPSVLFHEGTVEALPFGDATFDLVFMGMLLHETDDSLLALREAARVARRRVVILEWPKEAQEFGPPLEERLSSNQIGDLAAKAGLKRVEEFRLVSLVLYRMEKAMRSPARGSASVTQRN